MNKKIISFLVLFFMCVCVIQCSASAKVKQYNKYNISYHTTDNYASKLHLTLDGKVQYIRYNYESNKYKTKKLYLSELMGKSVEEIKTIRTDVDVFKEYVYVKVLDDKIITVREIKQKSSNKRSNIKNLIIEEYDKKGKKVFSYKDKGFTEKNCYYDFGDIYDDGKNIYYIYWKEYFLPDENNTDGNLSSNLNKESGPVLQIINKQNKTAKSITSLKVTAGSLGMKKNIRYEQGKMYELLDKVINVYSLKGKKLGSYDLPEGEHTLYNEGVDSDEFKYLINHSFNVCGDCIYYVNKRGVYKCNTKKKKSFNMIYDGAKDEYFGHDYGVEELCVKDNNTFYIRFADSGVYVPCGDYDRIKLVKYKSK